jgi:hypothetical protein
MTLSVATTGAISLAATTTGYTRTTGSFVTDGLALAWRRCRRLREPAGRHHRRLTRSRSRRSVSSPRSSTGSRSTRWRRHAEVAAGGRSLTVGLPSQSRVGERLLRADRRHAVGARRVLPGPTAQVTIGPNGELEATPHVRDVLQRAGGHSAHGEAVRRRPRACCSRHARRSLSPTATRSACAPIPARTPGSCNRARQASPCSRSPSRCVSVRPNII